MSFCVSDRKSVQTENPAARHAQKPPAALPVSPVWEFL